MLLASPKVNLAAYGSGGAALFEIGGKEQRWQESSIGTARCVRDRTPIIYLDDFLRIPVPVFARSESASDAAISLT